jgi:hypothetical protein
VNGKRDIKVRPHQRVRNSSRRSFLIRVHQ